MTSCFEKENPVVNGYRIFTTRQVRFVFDVFIFVSCLDTFSPVRISIHTEMRIPIIYNF